MNWQVVRLGLHPPSEFMLTPEETEFDERIQRLYLCHRGFYKTTIVIKVHSLQLLLNFPNIRMVLVHNIQTNSSDNLQVVKSYFLNTPIKTLFPECIPKSKEWGNLGGFSLANKTDFSRSEDSIEAIGVGTEITGRHWDLSKKDDMEHQDSVSTKEQLRKTRDYDDRFNAGHFSNPKYKLQDYSGTRYHFNDLYSVKKDDPAIKLIEIPLEDGLGNPTHTERFIRSDIAIIKSGLAPWVYNCQHLLKPEDPARMQFKKEMIQYYTALPRECNYYLLVDPASRKKKRSDWTVMVIIGLVKSDNRIKKFIADGLRDKLDPKQRVDLAIALAKKWNIKSCGWEAVGFQETDCFYLEETRRKERMFFTIEEISSSMVSKEDRIRSIIPDYANHNWFWPQKGVIERMSFTDSRKYDLTTEMEFEMLQFPLCEHDDLLDTMTFINRISTVAPDEVKIVESRDEMTFGEYSKLRDERLAASRANPWAVFAGRG
ncbi:MAG: hypothetical protein QME16_00185 [Planctomycetota bacterium]|nr:hypothetical protein [Planctomycetota bacterium]